MKKRLIKAVVSIVLVVALFVGGAAVGYLKPWEKELEAEPVSVQAITVQEIIEPASDLITTRYIYTDVKPLDKPVFNNDKLKDLPFGKDEVLLVYSGALSLGINIEELKINEEDIDSENMKIYIALPEVKVLANEIYFETANLYQVKNSAFVKYSLENYTEDLGVLKKAKETEFLENVERVDETVNNSKNIIIKLLANSDLTKDYEIVFK